MDIKNIIDMAQNLSEDLWDNTNQKNKNTSNHNNKYSQQKRKIPFWEQLKNVMYLLKHTFKIVSTNKDIVKPTIKSAIITTIIRILIIGAIIQFIVNSVFIFATLWILIFLYFYKFFYIAKQKSIQSHLVYSTITDDNKNYNQSYDYVKNDFNKYKSIAFIDMCRRYIETQENNERNGIKWMVIWLMISGLEEVLDLVSNYLLPAMVIENKSLTESAQDLKQLKTNVPQTLIWVFGIDFVWKIVNTLMWWAYFVIIWIGLLIGWSLGWFVDTMNMIIFNQQITFLPVILSISIVLIIGWVLDVIVNSIKTIYFTIFYSNIMKWNEINSELKQELENYLQFR